MSETKTGILVDHQIAQLAGRIELIAPFVDRKIEHDELGRPVMSYGLDGHAYGVRTSGEIKVLKTRKHGAAIDPKTASEMQYESRQIKDGDYVIIPPHSFFLAGTLEYFRLPTDIRGVVYTKSSYARMGLYCLTTCLNSGWSGNLTLEFANLSSYPIYFYPHEGVASIEFELITAPARDYRDGKFTGQTGVAITRMSAPRGGLQHG